MNLLYEQAQKAFERAKDAVESAAYNLKGGFELATANRAYYACFYCMTALLYTVNVQAKTHQGAHTKFAEHFIKTGIFPEALSDIISQLASFRQAADYNLDAVFSNDEAEELVEKAQLFLRLTLEYFDELNEP